VLASGLLRTRRPSQMPTRERSAPDKCLVVSSLSPALRPRCPRNTGANAATTREGLRHWNHSASLHYGQVACVAPKHPSQHRRHASESLRSNITKPNANTRTLRPNKCLVVKSLDSSLRPVPPSQHGIHRHHHQGVEGQQGWKAAFRGSILALRCRGMGTNQTVLLLALRRREGRPYFSF